MRYLPFQVRKIPHLPNRYIQILNNLNEELTLQEIIRDRVTLPKLLTTLIHGSAVYAGNNYDVFAAEHLLSTGKPNSKHTFMEALMIVNLKEAVDYILNIVNKDITVAIMGCVVNGPGEASAADIGIAGGKNCGVIFKKGEIIRKLPEEELLSALIEEIEKEIPLKRQGTPKDVAEAVYFYASDMADYKRDIKKLKIDTIEITEDNIADVVSETGDVEEG